jgi:hypothetical protein
MVETLAENDGARGQAMQTASTIQLILANPGIETGSFGFRWFSAAGTGAVVLDGNEPDAFDGAWSADITFGGGTYLYPTVTIPVGMLSSLAEAKKRFPVSD